MSHSTTILRKHNEISKVNLSDYEHDVICENLVKDIDKMLKGKKEEIVSQVLMRLCTNFADFVISEKCDYQFKENCKKE